MLELDQGPRPCGLELLPGHTDGWLYYKDPLNPTSGGNMCIPVSTTGSPTRTLGDGSVITQWHIDILPEGTVVTNPSILLKGVWHIAPGARWTPTPFGPDGTWPAP